MARFYWALTIVCWVLTAIAAMSPINWPLLIGAGVASMVFAILAAEHLRGGGVSRTETNSRNTYNHSETHHHYGSGAQRGVGGIASAAPLEIERPQDVRVKIVPNLVVDDSAMRELLQQLTAGGHQPPPAEPVTLTRAQEPPKRLDAPEPARAVRIPDRPRQDLPALTDGRPPEQKRGAIAFMLLGPPAKKPPAKRS